MLSNYLKIAYRHLWGNKLFSLINITGLAIGIAAAALLILYVSYQLSYDRFHSKADRIYRLNHTRFIDGEKQYTSATVFPEIGLEIAQRFEAVEQVVRLFNIASEYKPIFSFETENGEIDQFTEYPVYLVDSTFVDIFDLQFVHGEAGSALKGKNDLVLSRSLALKVFGHSDIVGKTLDWQGMGSYRITGVFEDLPANSHMQFNILVSWFNVYGERSLRRWDGFYTYLLLKDGREVDKLVQPVQQFASQYLGKYNEERGMDSKISFQPLTKIHLTSRLQNEFKLNGDQQVTYALLVIALLVLFLAIANYINLSTSKAVERAKEVGVRKVVGSTKGQLVLQFMMESFCLVLIAVTIAITCLQLFLPYFNSWQQVQLDLFQWNMTEFIVFGSSLVLFLTLAAGFYPSLFLSHYKSISLVKGEKNNHRKFSVRDLLMAFQFAVSLFLVALTAIIVKQVEFISEKDTGFRKEQVLVINLLELLSENNNDTLYSHRLEVFKDNLLRYNEIQATTVTSGVPGRKSLWRGVSFNAGQATGIVTYRTRVDKDFLSVFDIPLVAGRFFYKGDEKSEKLRVVANEALIHSMGFVSAEASLGHSISTRMDSEIIGVLRDYHQVSPRYAVDPAFFTMGQGHKSHFSIAFDAQDYQRVLSIVESNWKKSFPSKPFTYFFLEDHFEKQFGADERTREALSVFALLSLFLASMGLIGLSANMAQNRLKEMGIRKVLGASIADLLRLLSRGYVLLLTLGALVGLPLAYWVARHWLEQFAIRIDITTWYFVLPLGLMLVLSLIITLSQGWQVVNKNPVDSLRNE